MKVHALCGIYSDENRMIVTHAVVVSVESFTVSTGTKTAETKVTQL
jgi:hypothetical protein